MSRQSMYSGLALLLLAGCKTPIEQQAALVAEADLTDTWGNAVGKARFFSLAGEVTMNVSLQRQQAGIYMASMLVGTDCFADTASRDFSELPPISVAEDGIGTMSAFLSNDSAGWLSRTFDKDGTSLRIAFANETTGCGTVRQAR